MSRSRIAVAPTSRPAMFDAFVRAVADAGAELTPLAEASALMWADPAAADAFPAILADAPRVEWIQLPYAGVETFASNLDHDHVWTCGKGVYAEPVAEHVLTLTLAGFRHLHEYVGSRRWPAQNGRNLLGARVTVIGAGGITESLARLLEPWNTRLTVVRRRPDPFPGADRTLGLEAIDQAIGDADVVVLAAALTRETHGLVDSAFLAAMNPDGWLVNVARGGLVVTDDLVTALADGRISGAALDVTDPEPLPDGHPLWTIHNCIITPHVGNTPEMGLPLIADRVRQNVARWIAGDDLIGLVDVAAGY